MGTGTKHTTQTLALPQSSHRLVKQSVGCIHYDHHQLPWLGWPIIGSPVALTLALQATDCPPPTVHCPFPVPAVLPRIPSTAILHSVLALPRPAITAPAPAPACDQPTLIPATDDLLIPCTLS